ncbi:hypothetical protein FACS189411_10860 [Bacteroidia bacterium]|nr:hypothetical protein FACS189411_10860 [Bacteroidia bacterium]
MNIALLKNEIIKNIREILYENEFIEVHTPIIRRGTNPIFKRPIADFSEKEPSLKVGYLRDSMEVPLRACLQYNKRVFELGQCFRFDLPDITHYPEFLMMELYASDLNIHDIKKITKDIVNKAYNTNLSYNDVSIKDFIKQNHNISIDTLNDDDLKTALIQMDKSLLKSNSTTYELFNDFIEKHIDYSNGFTFLQDYHKCTISTAKKQNSSNTINRFEFFINGLEIANAYEDEEDLEDMKQRCVKVGLFNYEEEEICRMITNKIIPVSSVGLGIGIDRLCMSVAKQHDISECILSKKFNFINNEENK